MGVEQEVGLRRALGGLAVLAMTGLGVACGSRAALDREGIGDPTGAVVEDGGPGGSSSGAATVGGASSGGAAMMDRDGGGGAGAASSSGGLGGAADASGPDATWSSIQDSRTCLASASLVADGAGTCSVSLSGTCNYTDYTAVCACPKGECACQGSASSSTANLTFRTFATCPACPTASEVARICGFPF